MLDDKNNHTIDALRYALEELRRTGYKPKSLPEKPPRDRWARKRDEGGANWRTM